ncbi:MAG: hypothetical protein ABL878_20425, partial [Burkholderiales bacterium]
TRYWQGRSLAAVRPREARSILASAFESFSKNGHQVGQLLAATGVLEALYFEYDDFSIMDAWLERVSQLMDVQVRARGPEEELWVQSTIMIAAVTRVPGHRRLGEAVSQVMELLREPFDANLKVGAATMLHEYVHLSANLVVGRMAKDVARPLLDSPQLTPYRAVLYWACEGYTSYLFGHYDEALLCFNRSEAIGAIAGLEETANHFMVWRGLCERRAGRLDAANATVRRLERYRLSGGKYFVGTLDFLKALIAFDRGNFDFAIREGMAALKALDVSGQSNSRIALRLINAYMLTAVGRNSEAAAILEECRIYVTGTIFETSLGAVGLLKAWVAHHCEDRVRRNELIRDALARAQDEGSRALIRWYPKALEALLPVALEQSIEPQIARVLIGECKLMPPSADVENWPWPVKVYALGRFELLIEGESPTYSRKVPKKVLALLKAIMAFGAQDVPEQKLLDALWPDEDGDAARRSLGATLHRLRKLLANDNAVRQAGGNLTLDDRSCWVDANAFENRLHHGGDTTEASEAAIPLYRGAFLAQEDAPWAMPMRERLRAKFIHAVGKLGVSFEGSNRYENAIDLYARGIEADN